jgi:sigma-B regulation protein RsbU (phosphoserine phosphatase)
MAVWDGILRTQLLDRRHRLQAAISESGDTAHLVSLLQVVDSTLERIGTDCYGLCESCCQPIEDERLIADPLVRTCLSCLTEQQRRALEDDLDLASRIQSGLLPRDRTFTGWEVCFHYEPAGPVSGDYCDLVNGESDSRGLYFLLGDVSGKGVAASLLMAHLHAMFRTLIGLDLPVEKLVEQANRVFCGSTIATHYATLVCGRANRSGQVEICNAGHCLPLLLRDGGAESVEATGLPIGIFGTGRYSARKCRLAPGESLLLYTDGLSEAEGPGKGEYGLDRLAAVASANRHLPPAALISACLEDVRGFRAGAPARDDLTIMLIRKTAPAGGVT